MEQRVKFRKGEQRKFLDEVLKKMLCPSLRELRNFGVDVSYSTLKNYYQEKNFFPLGLVEDLCVLSEINIKDLKFELVEGNWGRVRGGKLGKRGRVLK